MQWVLSQRVPSSVENKDVLWWHLDGASRLFCLCTFLGQSIAALRDDEKDTIRKWVMSSLSLLTQSKQWEL